MMRAMEKASSVRPPVAVFPASLAGGWEGRDPVDRRDGNMAAASGRSSRVQFMTAATQPRGGELKTTRASSQISDIPNSECSLLIGF